jgi:hypothetical protein
MNVDSDDLSDVEVSRLMAALKTEFETVTFRGPGPRKPRRVLPFVAAAAVVVALIVTFTMFGSAGPTPVWAATPTTVSEGQRATAVSDCRDLALADSHALTLSSLDEVAFDARGSSTLVGFEGAVTKAAGSAEVPVGSKFSMACVATPGKGGHAITARAGNLSLMPTQPPDTVLVVPAESGTWFAAWGTLAPGAVKVELRAKGIQTATATVHDGRYSLWWPKAVTGKLVELSDNGSTVKTIQVNRTGAVGN